MIESTHSYASTQTNVPSPLRNEIIEWGKKHIKDADLYTNDDKGRETEPHITVLYGLLTDDIAQVKRVLKKTKPFQIKLGNISSFTVSPDFDVIKIDVISKELHKLNTDLATLPCHIKFPKYIPHLTIAYVKKGKGKECVGNTDFKGKSWNVKTILFSSKERVKSPIPLNYQENLLNNWTQNAYLK